MQSRTLLNPVITGIGILSPLGCTLKDNISRLRALESAIKPTRLEDKLDLLMAQVPRQAGMDPADANVDFMFHAAESALDAAGVRPETNPWRHAAILGNSKGRLGYLIGNSSEDTVHNFPSCTIGQEVARRLHLNAAVLNYPAACATGLVCTVQAIQLLRHDDVDVVVAGSGEAMDRALTLAGFHNMGALSADPIRPFDANRGGFNPGEGAAAFVIESEVHASLRGAGPIALIRGWDYRSDAWHMTSAEPSGKVVAASIGRALEMAGWQPEHVEYINAHGTGTRLNDQVEAASLRIVFGDKPPLVSSLKGYVGHLLGASAAVELALAIAALRDGFIPPTLGLLNPDPALGLNHVPVGGINASVRRMLKLSLGFGGHIGVLALEVIPKQ